MPDRLLTSCLTLGKPVTSQGLTFLVCTMGNSCTRALLLTFYKSNRKLLGVSISNRFIKQEAEELIWLSTGEGWGPSHTHVAPNLPAFDADLRVLPGNPRTGNHPGLLYY